jgi:hypothetical protein
MAQNGKLTTEAGLDSRTEASTERTPLLGDSSNVGSRADNEQQQSSNDDDEQVIIVQDVVGLKLWTILGTCWIGVFLGAIDSSIIATLSAPISSEFQSLSLLPVSISRNHVLFTVAMFQSKKLVCGLESCHKGFVCSRNPYRYRLRRD